MSDDIMAASANRPTPTPELLRCNAKVIRLVSVNANVVRDSCSTISCRRSRFGVLRMFQL